jgi:hypothetical protein
MSPIPRASALRLATTAHELGAEAVRGTLTQDERGRWTIGHVEIEAWLARHAGQELLLTLAQIEAQPSGLRQTCRTCGLEYDGSFCPHCDAVRRRLRKE